MNLPKGISESYLKELGVTAFGLLDASDVVFSAELREGCNPKQCGGYGKSWACPPAVGTAEECRARCMEYDRALVLSSVYELEDPFDYESMAEGGEHFRRLTEALNEALDFPHILLSNGRCSLCEACTYPDGPCRFPEKCLHSLSGYGVYVAATAKRANVKYNNGENTVTFFALLFFGAQT